MAIIDEFGLTAEVCVDDVPLAEHDDPDPDLDDENQETVVCQRYVESVDDAEFTIRYELDKTSWTSWLRGAPDNLLTCAVYVDGVLARSLSLAGGPWGVVETKVRRTVQGRESYDTGTCTHLVEKFKFSNVSTGMLWDSR